MRLAQDGPGPADSLLPRMNSLLGQKNFPAPMGQGISRKRLNLLAEWPPKSFGQAEILKIPCYFPCSQGIRRKPASLRRRFRGAKAQPPRRRGGLSVTAG